jgi:hypothetical protein
LNFLGSPIKEIELGRGGTGGIDDDRLDGRSQEELDADCPVLVLARVI